MPLRLNVGLQKKVGLPDYGSLGASCHVEVELEGTLIERDPEAFQRHVQNAFGACRQAVHEELARQGPNGRADQHGGANGNGCHGNGRSAQLAQSQSGLNRRATKSQVRALHAIATRRQFDLTTELQQRCGVSRPKDLALTDASRLIQEFNTPANGSRA